MKGAVLVSGATSDAGKTVVVAGLCRWLHRQGVRVAPFKAQNMSLNAAVTPDGFEIGRAQAMQAAAAGIDPEVVMNPVLIKPATDRSAQLVVMGRPLPGDAGILDAASYPGRTARLMPQVLRAFEDLRSRFDVVVCEGAGGIAEINLRAGDLANLGLARAASLPVVVVCDIERGGVFASAFGSLALLDPEDQAQVRGFLINRFRGDPVLLAPGIDELEQRTGRPVFGILPWVDGLAGDAEDSLSLGEQGVGDVDADLSVAVVRLPRISNFTDADPVRAEPGVEVRFTASAGQIAAADLVILPGTKATAADLAWLRSRRLDAVLAARAAAGRPILGICGGYQMLGESLTDDVEGHCGEVPGLGLLPVATVFAADKVLGCPRGVAPGFGGTPVSGYEIHHGRVRRRGGRPLFVADAGGGPEGCHRGAVLGTSWHGTLESDAFRRRLLAWVAEAAGRAWAPGDRPFASVREARLNALGDLVAGHVDLGALLAVIGAASRAPLPTVVTGLGPATVVTGLGPATVVTGLGPATGEPATPAGAGRAPC